MHYFVVRTIVIQRNPCEFEKKAVQVNLRCLILFVASVQCDMAFIARLVGKLNLRFSFVTAPSSSFSILKNFTTFLHGWMTGQKILKFFIQVQCNVTTESS